MKLTLILLLLITSLMAVVGAFLTTSVTSFYIDSFYQQMSSAFGADRLEFVTDLRSAAAQPDGAERIQEILEVNAGMLGIDYRTRNYYVLDGTAGTYLAGSAESSTLPREQSANLLAARNAVARQDSAAVGDESDIAAGYMDVAVPIFGGDNAFIIYILDNKDTVSELNNQLFQIIMQALCYREKSSSFSLAVSSDAGRGGTRFRGSYLNPRQWCSMGTTPCFTHMTSVSLICWPR